MSKLTANTYKARGGGKLKTRRNIGQYILVAPAVAFTLLFLIGPLTQIILVSLYTYESMAYIPVLTSENYVRFFTDPSAYGSFITSLEYAAMTCAISFVLAFPVAYFLSHKIESFTLKTSILIALVIPFWIDYTVRIVSWIPLLGTHGVINTVLVGVQILNEPSPFFIFSDFATVLVMIQSYVVFMIAPIFIALAKIEPVLYEAAAVCGADRVRQFYHITIKRAAPGIGIGIVFVFASTMGDFATPKIIGRISQTAGQFIYNAEVYLNWPLSSAVAVIVSVVTLAIVILLFRSVKIEQLF